MMINFNIINVGIARAGDFSCQLERMSQASRDASGARRVRRRLRSGLTLMLWLN